MVPVNQEAAQVVWEAREEGLSPVVVRGKQRTDVAWAFQPGSQAEFLSCPVYEVLYEGTRGNGKTDALLMSFIRHVGEGWGAEWRGILFRRTYPELQDVIAKSRKWIPRSFPTATYNQSGHVWTFPAGEQLMFRYFQEPEDYWAYHGHSFVWIGWDELTTWPTDEGYKRMFACSRSTVVGMPRMVRATTNPYGVGHNWVKARWRLPIGGERIVGAVIRDSLDRDGKPEPPRVAVRGKLDENRILMNADPGYKDRIRASASSAAQLHAWLEDDWDIVAGGMFDDVWDARVHVVPDVPLDLIPAGWHLDRSYDHGQSRPFSVGWWAESNGEPLEYEGRTYGPVRGDLYRVSEWYGWSGQANEGLRMGAPDIARGIRLREVDWGLVRSSNGNGGSSRVQPGAADSSIFDAYDGEKSVAGDMKNAAGITWQPADKGPGSRVQGWQQIRKMLKAAAAQPREEPGLFVMERCLQFRRTVPVLPRDDRNPDDVDTEAEDHIGDEVRYRLRYRRRKVTAGGAEVVVVHGN